MRRLIAEIFDPATRYEYELPLPSDIARALELDAKFDGLELGLVDGWPNAAGSTVFSPVTAAISARSALVPASPALSISCREAVLDLGFGP
jgi:hypothetical protein